MKIGVDGSRAFLKQRTGIEEYSYQVIKHLMNKLDGHEVILYVKQGQKIDFELPKNWRIRRLWFPRLWTQFRLSLELLFNPIDVLFVPAHTVPFIHPAKTVVAIHGLEYEFVPGAYSAWGKFYMRWSIKKSCQWASDVICVSRNTKDDLVRMYKVLDDKMRVVYEGYDVEKSEIHQTQRTKTDPGFLLFVGRLEERKNILGIINAFEILKEKYKIPHKLILAGKFGYGSKKIMRKLQAVGCKQDIILPGFVSDGEKWRLMKNADVFLFPTFYEGFGIPVLEAQSVGTPVVCSNRSSLQEVCGDSAVLVDPNEPDFMAERIFALIDGRELRDDIIKKGYENVKRFSWERCSKEIAEILEKNGK